MIRGLYWQSLPNPSSTERYRGVQSSVRLGLFHNRLLIDAGNHDSEINEDREYQMRILQNMPFSLAEPGPSQVDGVGNCRYHRAPTLMPLQTTSSCTRRTRMLKFAWGTWPS
jgi:hypothetical protein